MGPIGCVAGLIAQILYTVLTIVTLPIVLIIRLFSKADFRLPSRCGYKI